jgi:cholesterol oxidase
VWPEALRADHWLNTGFHRARQMLAAEPLPEKYNPLKLQALGMAAQALGHRAERTPVHIAFTKRTNWAGVTQPACTQCGDCMSGCNVGAKTTVHSTYLADAASRGSEIFTHAQVRAVERAQDGRWRVLYTLQDGATRAVPTRVVTAPMVILAAGSLGTSEILLRSRERGLPLSDQLGRRFSTNADAIALGYNNKMPVNAVGVGNPPRARVAKPGPAVTGIIDLRQRESPLERLAVVEAAIQSPLAPLLPLVMAALAPTGTSSDRNLGSFIEEAQRTASSLLKGAYQGAVHNTQLFLAVGHDRAAGQLVLEHDRVAVSWPEAVHEPVYERIHATFAKAIAATGGTHIPNPVSNRFLGGNIFTFHPLGGCGMGRDRAAGVVDHKCRVFDGDPAKPGDAVHSGLYVCDGSIVPRSLGIHPLLTITALAERAMLLLARDLGRELPIEAPEDVAQAGAAKERAPGFFARLFGGARSGAG